MKLLEAVVIDSIDPGLRARTKAELFSEMVVLLKKNPALAEFSEATILKALDDREGTATTGVGKEVGIPHGKISGLRQICGAIGVAKRGIEYDSVDGRPVKFVVAMVAPPDQSQDYLKTLAKVARLLSDPSFIETLVTANVPRDIYDRIEKMQDASAKVTATGEAQLLMFELIDSDYFDQVVEYFTEVGATSATVLDARNVEGFLTKVPLFADFSRVFSEGQEFGHVFLLVIDKGAVPQFVDGLEEIIGDLQEEGRGIVIALDISYSRGALSALEF
ncbi:PTS sugar transporter subunit IIA [bacterium]|jgi:mannitol/fructose-specific phosphotransferase system IIA component (Ntr-type)|nr:PTS sugar transporter subunit IIA [bacterium]